MCCFEILNNFQGYQIMKYLGIKLKVGKLQGLLDHFILYKYTQYRTIELHFSQLIKKYMYIPIKISSNNKLKIHQPQTGEGNGTPLQSSCLEKSHGRRSLVGCSLWGREESNMTERLHSHFSLSCIGEGNANPLQCSCLGNPWWAAIYGVAQSRT